MSRHDEKPSREDQSDDLRRWVDQLKESDYYEYVVPLAPIVKGKVVQQTMAGRSGFVLRFTDDSWVVTFLDGSLLRYEFGTSATPDSILAKIDSAKTGDGTAPLSADLPYAEETCNLASEVSRCEGKQVIGLSFGEDCFNYRFPDGFELETMLVPAADGRLALRVFWEKW